jgi:hypothetical protein
MSKSDRDKGISLFVVDLLNKEGLNLFEKWFDYLQKLTPDKKVPDAEVRDRMLEEIITLVSVGNSLILNYKDKSMVEELVNRFLKGQRLLMLE